MTSNNQGATMKQVELQDGASADIVQENVQHLKELFPDAFALLPGSVRDSHVTRTALMLTGGSSSVRAFEEDLRQAGVAARVLLCKAAAAEWGVDWRTCSTAKNQVVHGSQRLSFGALAVDATARSLGVRMGAVRVWLVGAMALATGSQVSAADFAALEVACRTAGVTLHVETLYGDNAHHIAESCFKGLARALRAAVAIDPAAAEFGGIGQWILEAAQAGRHLLAVDLGHLDKMPGACRLDREVEPALRHPARGRYGPEVHGAGSPLALPVRCSRRATGRTR